jgi:putative tryptophan/tyrosine transport system substrate-binding protein
MRRREFIALVSGATAAWPLAALAQKPDRMRRVGVLMAYVETDPAAKTLLAEFTQGLSELGWTDGSNMGMDVRWAASNVDEMRTMAKQLVDLQPDVILSNTTPITATLQRDTERIPVVFVIVGDPIGSGFVASLAHPGRNLTGLGLFEESMTSKWLELLRDIAPSFQRVAFMFNPDTAPYISSFLVPSFEATANALKVTPSIAQVRSDAEIEAAISSLGREPQGALLVGPDNYMDIHHPSIVSLAARNHVPAVYHSSVSARDGGLVAYGADFRDIFRRAAGYVDKVLRGAKPEDLPVQMPIKYLMVINLKTAKALGLTVPPALLVAADEVIE